MCPRGLSSGRNKRRSGKIYKNGKEKKNSFIYAYLCDASIPAVIVVQAEISSTHFTDPQLLLLE